MRIENGKPRTGKGERYHSGTTGLLRPRAGRPLAVGSFQRIRCIPCKLPAASGQLSFYFPLYGGNTGRGRADTQTFFTIIPGTVESCRPARLAGEPTCTT